MSHHLASDGFEILRSVLSEAEVAALRVEADSVASDAGSACVRHLRSRSEIFNDLSVSALLASFLPEDLIPVRSILFDKTLDENWPVAWHQDLTIAVNEEKDITGYGPWSHKDGAVHVQPPLSVLQNMVTARLHLDETPATNGALRVIPRSHLAGKLPAEAIASYDKNLAITCECRAGDLLLMSPLLLHSSQRSVKPARRRVIHFEYARAIDLHPELRWFESPGKISAP
jgi:hypothetical protein